MTCIGLKQYAFDNDYNEENIEEGKRIIDKYKNERLLLLGNRKSDRSSKKKFLPDIEK